MILVDSLEIRIENELFFIGFYDSNHFAIKYNNEFYYYQCEHNTLQELSINEKETGSNENYIEMDFSFYGLIDVLILFYIHKVNQYANFQELKRKLIIKDILE